MRLQDHLTETTRAAMDEAFRYASAVPSDKQVWKPMDAGQSVLSMCRELAKCPDWAVALLEGKGMEVFGGGEAGNEMGAWTSVAECEAACQRNLDRFFKYILTFADAKLKDTVDLPFGKGGSLKVFTMAEIMDYPRWNATYHLGQIAYIQTLYGDKEMY